MTSVNPVATERYSSVPLFAILNLASRPPGRTAVQVARFAASAKALAAGASGAIMKSAENSELVAAIRKIAAGQTCISGEIQGTMDSDPPVTSLTGRQSEVLQSLTLGLTNKDIAVQLGISIRSVEEHVNNILEKIGAANRAEAVGIALRKRLVKI